MFQPRLFLVALVAGSVAWLAAAAAQTPLINEFMASNSTTIADDDGDFSDWIEIYNPGPTWFDLTGCYLSDRADDPLRWCFPAGQIPPQGHLLIWASGKDRQSATGDLHTNFAISAAGEPLLLTAPDGVTRLDEVPPIALATDVSYGRMPDGGVQWLTFTEPTPGTANDSGLLYLAPPVFSHEPGFFTGAISLALTAADPEAEIRYSLDGSEPTLESPVYQAPLMLDSRIGEPNVISLIRTGVLSANFVEGWRPPRGEVFKINVVRARAFRPGHAPSALTTGTFVIDPDPAAALVLPLISLTTSPANLFDDAIGIYVPGDNYQPPNYRTGNYFQRGDEWERPVHVEFFDLHGSRLLAQDAGARIHGNITRGYPQKTLRLYARSAHGTPHFHAPLFVDQPAQSYKRFLIRNSGNDWAHTGFKDMAQHAMLAGMPFETQAGRPVVHFINGEYWGVANLRERYDRHYIVRCYGVPEDEVVLLANDAEVEEGLPSDGADFLALRAFVVNSDMAQPANLAYVAERIDLDNFIAYNVAQIFLANQDWPHNNVRFWRRRTVELDPLAPYGHDGRWRWMMFDLDLGFSGMNTQSLDYITHSGSHGPRHPLLYHLLDNEQFRNAFINAFADHLNSTFRPARLGAIVDEYAAIFAPAIAAWQDRWDLPTDWDATVQAMRYFAEWRPPIMRQQVSNHFELAGTTQVTFDVNDPAQGTLQLNGIVIDGNLPGLADPSQPYPWTGDYYQGVPITLTALPAPGHRFVAWQYDGSIEPTLTVTPGPYPLLVSAVFAPDTCPPAPLHAWHFNDLPSGSLTEVEADLSLLGEAVITYPGTGAGTMDRVSEGTELGALPGTPAGHALRVRNPSDTRELVVAVPSTGHRNLSFSYAATRTTNGAERHSVYCRVEDGGPWHLIAEDIGIVQEFQHFTHDLSVIPETADNPDLRLKFVFGGPNAGGSSGNQRFDNMTLTGSAPPGVNLPPYLVAGIPVQRAYVLGPPLVVDVAGLFGDPEDDPLAHVAVSSDPDVARVATSGHQVIITPLQSGEAWITILATDGFNSPASLRFRVLVYPAPVALAQGAFIFSGWDPGRDGDSYPDHTMFLRTKVTYPGPEVPLLHPYRAAFKDHGGRSGDGERPDTDCSMIWSLGDEGIVFFNGDCGWGLGGMLLSLDTRSLLDARISWKVGTVRPNRSPHALRLQYRLGIAGEFTDLLVDGLPLTYLSSWQAGDTEFVGPLYLPAELLGQEYLQLMWRYHSMDGMSAPGAEILLGEILVTGTLDPTTAQDTPSPGVTALHGNAPNPFNPVTDISFSVRDGETGRLEVYNSRGQRVRSLGSYQAGRHRIPWDGTDGSGQRCASGVYFYRLISESGSWTGKMALIK